jgi:L-ascorbate metabolism protein UlaG (beta-lactamase superfamily)
MLIDPLDEESGFRSPKLEADIFLLSGGSENNKKKLSAIGKNSFLISGSGEYDIKGIYIKGIQAGTKTEKEKTVIYIIEGEEIRICHLGRLGQEELSPEQIEKIGEIDILMVPIGGGEALNSKEAIKIMAQIEPKIIIPMYYRTPKLKAKLGGLSEFLKDLGIKSLQPLAKLSIKKKDISKEEAKIIALEP